MKAGFHPLADRELADAAQFYEVRAVGLGVRFLADTEAALRLLVGQPEVGRPLTDTI